MIPSNIPGHRRWTSHKHRCMSHRRSLLHWSSMSRNQSRAIGSTWILRRFDPLQLGSSSTSAAAGVAGAAVAARGVLVWASSSCVSVDGFSWSPPGRTLQADTMRKLVLLEDVVLKSAFPELLPAGASDGPPPLVWWPTQTNRQGDDGQLGPHVVERGGIQINRRK